jgi:hypothetical protein
MGAVQPLTYSEREESLLRRSLGEVMHFSTLVGQRPWHMALDPDGGKLYVANGLTNDLPVIELASCRTRVCRPRARLVHLHSKRSPVKSPRPAVSSYEHRAPSSSELIVAACRFHFWNETS